MKALLICNIEDDSKLISKFMINQYPKIELVKAKDLDKALECLSIDGPFCSVIINAENRHLSVHEAIERIIDMAGNRPFIVFGGPHIMRAQVTQDILNNHELFSLLEKPFVVDEFKAAMEMAISWARKEEFEQSISEFDKKDLHPMKIKNFYLFESLPYDVYLELTPGKYGKIISKNKFYSHQVVQSYAKKNIKFLYLLKDDFLKFLTESQNQLIHYLSLSRTLEPQKIIQLQVRSAFIIHQLLRTVLVGPEMIKLVNLLIQTVEQNMKHYETFGNFLNEWEYKSISFAEQSVLCCYACECMIREMGWNSDMSRSKLFLASLLQDITLQNDDFVKISSLDDPTYKMLSEDEQNDFKDHPIKSAQYSHYFSSFSELDFIIAEHHELASGKGFPKSLNSSSITTISAMFNIATLFVSKFAQSSKTKEEIKHIILGMQKTHSFGTFKEPYKSLEKSMRIKIKSE